MKKNIIIPILLIIGILACIFTIYTLTNKKTNNIIENFKTFAKSKDLRITNSVYDVNTLNKINCTEAISATGNAYSVELLRFDDENSALLEYTSQKNNQLRVNNVKQEISSQNKKHINYYEAILIPNLEKSPLSQGNEQIYLYKLRINNFYINFYEVSTNSDKTNIIKIVEELKEILDIK